VVPEGDHVSIVAPGGTGKSLLALALSIAAVRGATEFIGRQLGFAEGRRVLYLDKENSEEDWRERLNTFGVTMENAAEYWGKTFIPLSFPAIGGLDTAEGAKTLLDVLDVYGIGRGDVLVLDSTQRVTDGPENDNDTMRALYDVVEELKRRGITVIRTDNTGKDTERGARGASAKNDDVGYSWLLERRGRTDQFTLKNTKFRGLGNGEEVKFRVLVEDGKTTFSQTLEPAAMPGGMSGLDRWYHDHFRTAVMDILRRVHHGAEAEGRDKSNLVTQNKLLELARAEEFDYYDPSTGATEKKKLAFSKRKGIEWLGELAAEQYVRVEGGNEVVSKTGVLRVSTKYYGWRRDLPGLGINEIDEEVPGEDDGDAY
jgi:RecA-family ATPase